MVLTNVNELAIATIATIDYLNASKTYTIEIDRNKSVAIIYKMIQPTLN